MRHHCFVYSPCSLFPGDVLIIAPYAQLRACADGWTTTRNPKCRVPLEEARFRLGSFLKLRAPHLEWRVVSGGGFRQKAGLDQHIRCGVGFSKLC